MSVKHILVVEDERDIMDIINLNLLREGYRVACASTAGDARSWLARRHFDLLISDNRLPDELGSQLIADLKRCPEYADLGTVLMTGTDASVLDESLEVDALLSKPFSFKELRDSVCKVLGEDAPPSLRMA